MGLLHPLPIMKWKWEVISMDFTTWLPMRMTQHDSIMVVVDNLSKAAHFTPVKSTYKASDIARIFMKEIFILHWLPKAIVSDRDSKFTSSFWKGLFQDLGTQLNFSIAYHPQANGQMERLNQMLEDMLRMYVMDKLSKWEDYLHLVEFAYNNGQQAALGTSLFESLYRRKCRMLANGDGPVNRVILGPKMLKEMEHQIVKTRQNLKNSLNRQNIYVDLKMSHQEFKVGDNVYLRVHPKKSSMKLGSCAKLAPRYCGPFKNIEKIGHVAYKIALPINMRYHNVFHVSLLKKYVHDPNYVIDWNAIQAEPKGEF